MKTAKYFVEGSEVSYADCIEYFCLYSGFSKDDAISEFSANNNEECCEYITELCSDVEVVYQ